ncbi:MAG: acyltransferase [Spirochaetes bacterium]|nr:MAG: acyltransferase [Spirochaetota bacterium]
MEPSPHPSATAQARRYDLDWLRVLAVLLLVPFHSALVFNLDPNAIVYMKDVVQSEFLVHAAGFIHRWHMPLLFFIAGAATWLALGVRTGDRYLRERVARLLVPFAFGLVALIPPMTYVHFLDRADTPGFWRHFAGFWTLDPHDLSGLGGTLTVGHLWFILFLFIFSVGALPLFARLRGVRRQVLVDRLAGWCAKPGMILILPGLLLAIAAAIPLLGDKNPFFYFSVFILGGVFMTDGRFRQAVDRQLKAAVALGIALVALNYLFPLQYQEEWSWQWMALGTLYILSRWVWVLVFIGAGRRLLVRTNKVLDYAAEAAYPFYILHLPVVTMVTYFVIRFETVIAVKYAVIVLVAIGLTLAVYEVFVKRIRLMRFLFGMKPQLPI